MGHRIAILAGLLTAACAIDDGGSGETGKADDTDGADDAEHCTDIAPSDDYTCGEQVGWGKCDEPWMADLCDRSCGRCPGIGAPLVPCGGDDCPVEPQLIDPDATVQTRALMEYLTRSYKTAVLSGQQNIDDAAYIAELTGRHPAIVGFDLMDYSPSRVERGASSDEIDEAITWSARGGIVTLSWHWNAPADLVDSEEYPWWRGFYTEGTTFDIARAMYDRNSTERQLVVRDIDAIAAQLQRLADAAVPVLWRPIHEASGGWFWWGARGPEPHQMLWRLLYDRLVNHHHLHNLIWVWNGQHADWYPGDAYVDIVAEDIYDGAGNHGPQQERYLEASRYPAMAKMVALSETGALLDPTELEASAARWSWFMLWSGDFATGQEWNTDELKRAVYASDFVVTRDELPGGF